MMDGVSPKHTPFTIRAARPSDHLGLAELLAELLGMPDLDDPTKAALNTNVLRALSTPGGALLVAEEADNPSNLLGFISLWSHWGVLDDAPSGVLDRLVVRRGYETSSLPPALVEQALGACQALGCSRVEFMPTEGSLEPLEALAHFGFHDQGRRYSLVIS